MLKAVLGVLVAAVFMIIFFAVIDGVLLSVNHASEVASQALNVTRKHELQDAGNQIFGAIPWIAALVLAGIFIALGLHIKRR